MKRVTGLVFLIIFYIQLFGQSATTYDKDILLEFYQSQRYADAANYLQSVYGENISDVKILNQIAYCYMMSGKLPEAEKNYLKVIDQQPNSLPVLFSLANINFRRGNNLKAATYYKKIVELDSRNFNAYKQLAGIINNEVDSQKVAYLLKANTINPDDADVAYDLAISYKKLKKYELGYRVLHTAFLADTGNLVLQQAILPIAIQLKRYREVIAIGEKLLTYGIDANVIKDVGMAHYYLKNYEKAIKFFKTLETVNAQNETSLYFTSLSYRNLNNLKQAVDYAKKTIQEGISPYTSSYYLLLGGIYEVGNQQLSAVAAYKKGLTYNTNSTLYYRLGLLYDLKFNQKK
ncbi:MAG: tetratricopeptide repeat protein, partial [Bacteroidia bacterium]